MNPLQADQTTFATDYNDLYETFTGYNIRAIMNLGPAKGQKQQPVLIGTLASITVSVVREIAPRWRMGDPNYASVAKGKRSISGSLVFTVFDRDPIMRGIVEQSTGLSTLADQYAGALALIDGTNQSAIVQDAQTTISAALDAVNSLRNALGQQPLQYADQLAPFDITVTFVNDNGAASFAAVRQLTLASQGVGWSLNDMETDQMYQYIARSYEPLTNISQSEKVRSTNSF